MDEFEKVNETLENEEIKSEEITQLAEPVEETADIQDETVEPVQTMLTDEPEEESEEDAQPESKKPFILEKTIIKAACIFLAVLVVFGGAFIVQKILTPSIEGVWKLSKYYTKGDEKDAQEIGSSAKDAVYYSFQSGNELIISNGTITEKAKWSFVGDDGKASDSKTDKIAIYSQEVGISKGTKFSYTIEGNKFSDKTLLLEMDSVDMAQIYELTYCDSSKIPEYKMPLDKNFKPVKELVGKWEDESKQVLELKNDGSYILSSEYGSVTKGNYELDTKEKTLSLKCVREGQETVMGTYPYTVKDNKLSFVNTLYGVTIEFTKK